MAIGPDDRERPLGGRSQGQPHRSRRLVREGDGGLGNAPARLMRPDPRPRQSLARPLPCHFQADPTGLIRSGRLQNLAVDPRPLPVLERDDDLDIRLRRTRGIDHFGLDDQGTPVGRQVRRGGTGSILGGGGPEEPQDHDGDVQGQAHQPRSTGGIGLASLAGAEPIIQPLIEWHPIPIVKQS